MKHRFGAVCFPILVQGGVRPVSVSSSACSLVVQEIGRKMGKLGQGKNNLSIVRFGHTADVYPIGKYHLTSGENSTLKGSGPSAAVAKSMHNLKSRTRAEQIAVSEYLTTAISLGSWIKE